MILIITALYCEAESLIRIFGMKRENKRSAFQWFYDEKKEICLIVTGKGGIRATAAVGEFSGQHPGCDIVNFGCAGSESDSLDIGSLVIASRVIDSESRNSFCPDILLPCDMPKVTVISSPKLWRKDTAAENYGSLQHPDDRRDTAANDRIAHQLTVHDMEAYSISSAAHLYTDCDRIHILKVISDYGDTENIRPETIRKLMEEPSERAAGYIRKIRAGFSRENEFSSDLFQEYSARLKASVSMGEILKKLMAYSSDAGLNFSEIMMRYAPYQVKDRRAGKDALLKIKAAVLEAESAPENNENVIEFSKCTNDEDNAAKFSKCTNDEDDKMKFPRCLYVEKRVLKEAEPIIRHFHDRDLVLIDDYREVFDRSRQNAALQRKNPALILAKSRGRNVYKGSPVCQDFGNNRFYYTSTQMNCPFDCEYCYLRGMYPSGDIVIFLDKEETFSEVKRLLKDGPLYLTVSYDTDILLFEPLTAAVSDWADFLSAEKDLTIEVRTKCASTFIYDKIKPSERMIFSYTLSPDPVAARFERRAPSLDKRIDAIIHAARAGFPVRIAFDPMIRIPAWKTVYGQMADHVFKRLSGIKIRDYSVGTFRISMEYMKNMRKRYPGSVITDYPYYLSDGYYQYPLDSAFEMENFMTEKILLYDRGASIFRWKN
jgi:spore photoproduct lyase